jgi:uncharacterized delta-60 repeat protein
VLLALLGGPGAWPGIALAAAGDLDTSFGSGGKVTTDFAGGNDTAFAMAIQADGKIVAAGSTNGDLFALARYRPDGSPDPAFGGGKVTTDFGGSDQVLAVAIQADGKIVATGLTDASGNNDFALARYTSDGTLDPTFSGDGKLTTDFRGGNDIAYGVAIQQDGKVVAAGTASGEFALARYNPDGSLDSSFGTGGKVTTRFTGDDAAHAVVIQSNGKIVVVGNGDQGGFELARYTQHGRLDPSFGTRGKVTTDFGGNAPALAVAIQADGKIVTAGHIETSVIRDFALARYNPDGSLDPTFSGDGKLTTDFGGSDQVLAVAIQADGKIVAAGLTDASGNNDFALARYTSDGTLDPTFSGDGKLTTDFGGNDIAYGVAIQRDGKIVAAGTTGADFALARYQGS